MSPVVWLLGGVLVILLGAVYERYLHPAWRRERRVLRACEEAFKEGGYRLTRIQTAPTQPSVFDLAAQLFTRGGRPRYFTYDLQPLGDHEPKLSKLQGREEALVRRYLQRNPHTMVHHGKTVLHPDEETILSVAQESAVETAQAEKQGAEQNE